MTIEGHALDVREGAQLVDAAVRTLMKTGLTLPNCAKFESIATHLRPYTVSTGLLPKSRQKSGSLVKFSYISYPLGPEHLRGRLPDIRETLRQELRISIPELDVVARCGPGFEPDGMAHDKSSRFGLRLSNSTRSGRTAIPRCKVRARFRAPALRTLRPVTGPEAA